MLINNSECVGVKVICKTCGWQSKAYLYSDEGGEDYAKTSAIIETRLGHLRESAKINDGKLSVHEMDLIEVVQN